MLNVLLSLAHLNTSYAASAPLTGLIENSISISTSTSPSRGCINRFLLPPQKKMDFLPHYDRSHGNSIFAFLLRSLCISAFFDKKSIFWHASFCARGFLKISNYDLGSRIFDSCCDPVHPIVHPFAFHFVKSTSN